ncbi:MAG TPA: phosphoribosylanthranilate isomerase, partial [Candidatus Marinimicrobia bacterium]|nr:phosphoribosylanthranilate isomerase [Candidatus Neomarinimicrobiota bacterium]
DSFSDNQYGGTGKPFDWSILKKYQHNTPIILSGGLTPDNIIDAIQEIYPSAVDVNSGVESSPGEKNHEKINHLFNQLKETENTGFHFG